MIFKYPNRNCYEMINQANSELRMKPHLVVVCGVLYPNPSPTGLCSFRYASLLNDIFEIEYVALSLNGKEECVSYNGYKVHTLSSRRLALEYRTSGLLRRLVHFAGTAMLKLSLLGNLGWYSKAAYDKLEEIHRIFPIDVVLTVCSPFSAHVAGGLFKKMHPKIRLCSYTVDPYADKHRVIPFFRKFQDLVKLERIVSSKADCLFLSEEAMSCRQDIYGDIVNKVALPYILPEVKETGIRIFDKEHIHCVYAGRFYKDIRNPEYMLKVFSALNDKKIILHLYSSGCDEMVRKYATMSSQIQHHGYVSQEELQQVYASCDFLIGVGNAMNDFLPSKTYEYLSLRRSIVFFNPIGYTNNVLEKYPHSLQISDDNDLNDAVSRLETFISTEKGNTISQEELFKLYKTNTSTFVRDILITGLKNNTDE